MGESCGIEDDNFTPMVKLNFDVPLSVVWFKKVWRKNFPFLCTESDSPQCPECYEYGEQIKSALVQKDTAQARKLQAEKEVHLQQARSLYDFQETFRTRSKNYKHVHCYVIDNMASKSIPKFRKERADAWSKDKITYTWEEHLQTRMIQYTMMCILNSSMKVPTQLFPK
ncbi:MAG: hypothetical protein ACXV2C_07185 [Candidatus Bathyarchaeia archaeon]